MDWGDVLDAADRMGGEQTMSSAGLSPTFQGWTGLAQKLKPYLHVSTWGRFGEGEALLDQLGDKPMALKGHTVTTGFDFIHDATEYDQNRKRRKTNHLRNLNNAPNISNGWVMINTQKYKLGKRYRGKYRKGYKKSRYRRRRYTQSRQNITFVYK